jgi:GH25 family lysozyme M1 (1,4-beta-N-acetylmuramidase)
MTAYLLGMDISHYQEQADFLQARAQGLRFAAIKAMDGSYPDSRFLQHWQNSRGVLPRSAYLYYREGSGLPSPTKQATDFYNLLASTGDLGELPPALDIEEKNNPTLTGSKIKTCLETMTAQFGRKPYIYTRATVWNPHIGAVAWASAYPLWVAHYVYSQYQGKDHLALVMASNPAYYPALPSPWKNAGFVWDIWQHGDCYPANEYGVSGNELDLDFAQGNTKTLIEAFIPGVPIPPEPGETMQAKCIVNFMNLRVKPQKNSLDVGDILKNEIVTYYPADTVIKPGEKWEHLRKADQSVGWGARVHPDFGTGESLEDLPSI